MTEPIKSRAERRREEREKGKNAPDALQIWREVTKKSKNGIEYRVKVPWTVDLRQLKK